MDKIRIMRLVLFVELVVLLGSAVAISRDYQDSWILEGLEVPFAVFIVTYIGYFMIEKRLNWLISFALIAHTTLILIPNLKYIWFHGVAIDQHLQYKLASATLNEGHIIPGTLYSDTPFLALSFVIYSATSGLPILQSMKYFPLILWFTYPIWIYVILRKFGANFTLLKYALLASSFPVKPEMSYIVRGTIFGAFFVFLILVQLAKSAINRNRSDWVLIVIFTFVLVGGHSFSSITLPVALLIVTLLSFILGRFSHDFNLAKVKPLFLSVMAIIVASVAWLSLLAQRMFLGSINFFIPYINKLLNVPTSGLPGTFIASRFFKIDFVKQLNTSLVFNGGDFLLLLFTLVGVLITIRVSRLRKKQGLLLLSFYFIALMTLLFFGLVLNLGFHWGNRIFRLASIITPIFSGIFLYYVQTKLHTKAVSILIIGLLVILATLQLYRCQPLIPAASELGKQLPSDEPLVYVTKVNTAYQRYMINHAERYLPDGTTIAADKVTGNQLYGLVSMSFWQDHKILYLLKWPERVPPDYFLLHLPGIAGGFLEPAENRTRSLILSIIYDSSYNIVYSNAESYILERAR
ncbi:MAG: hypothetical protein ACFFCW_49835 [Candidatus Hodarchaeota archaeon]